MGGHEDVIRRMLKHSWSITMHDIDVVANTLGVEKRERGHRVYTRMGHRPVPIPRPKRGKKELDRVYVKQFLALIWDLIPVDLIHH